MSVVVAIRDEDKIWLATDSQITCDWTKKLLLSQNSFKICKGVNDVNIGGVGALRDINILSTSDISFISENNILKNNINFQSIVRETVPLIFNELIKFNRVIVEQGIQYLESAFIVAHGQDCFIIGEDGSVQELYDMAAIGSGANAAESAYTILRDVEGLTPKDKAIRAIMSSCERDLFVDYPIVITNTKMNNFEFFDGTNMYSIMENGEVENLGPYFDEENEINKCECKNEKITH